MVTGSISCKFNYSDMKMGLHYKTRFGCLPKQLTMGVTEDVTRVLMAQTTECSCHFRTSFPTL